MNDGKSYDTYLLALRDEAAKQSSGEDTLEAVLARKRAGESQSDHFTEE